MPEPTPLEPALGLHTEFIQQRIADWFKEAAPHRQSALHRLKPALPAWLRGATDEAQTTLRHSHQQLRNAVNRTDRLLGPIQDLQSFAEPLLKQAIKNTFGVELDVKNTFYGRKLANASRSDLGGVLVFDSTQNNLIPRYREITLLQAALANFEASEAIPGTCPDCHMLVPFQDAIWPAEIALPIPPDAFAQLCRTLNLGRRYQEHLNSVLEPGDAVKRANVRESLIQSDQKALALSAHTAQLKGDIKPDTHAMVLRVIANPGAVHWHGKPVRYSRLKIFNRVISGVLLISPDRESPTTERVLLYIPGDDTQPLKEYDSYRQCVDELLERLKRARYRQFFAQFVGLSQQGLFFHRLKRSFDPHNRLAHSDDYTGTAKGLEFADEFISDLWVNRCEVHIRKILSDAQTAAVPTDIEDQHTRLARLEGFFEASIDTFNYAALLIPGIGEIMMLVGCAQMLNEVFSGIEAWEQDEIDQAWRHLAGVALNLGLIGVSSHVIPAVQNSAFVDGLQPVTLPDSQTRLWKPDLQPYVHGDTLPDTLEPNDMGLHQHKDAEFLLIERQPYRVEKDPRSQQYRIRHPTRANRYSPRLRHNAMGAWTVETESPLQWPDVELFRRLGPSCAAFTDEQASRILAITHTDPAVLRRIHADALPAPAQLADTVQRFKIDHDIEGFITHMQTPALRFKADPQTQLQLLTTSERWPASKGLRVLDEQGEVIAQYGNTDDNITRLDIQDSHIKEGKLLDEVLRNLDDVQTRALLGQSPAFGDELPNLQIRIDTLYGVLARMARSKRFELFNSRYATLELRANPPVALLQREFPGLSSTAAQELIWHASGDEVLQLLNDQTVPLRLQEEARWQERETRVNRAYEGLFLDSVNNPDSEWLALKTIETLPGWPKTLRLEIRDAHFDGTLLNSLGSETAPVRKVLIKSEHRYSTRDAQGQELHGADDLYSALLHALPDQERNALGFPHVGQGAALKDRVRQHPLLPRLSVSLYLDQPPVAQGFTSPMALVHGRAGYPLLGADAPTPRPASIDTLVYQLYPGLSTRERARIIATLPQGGVLARRALADRQSELLGLRDELEVWTLNAPAVSQSTGELLRPNLRVARVQDRRAFSQELERCWRRQTAFDNFYADPDRDGFELTFTRTILEDMPPITADFSHVTYLSLYGAQAVTGVNEFLQHFPRLRVLDLRGFALDRLPDAVFSMQYLTQLRLEDSNITLTPASAANLSGLEYLEYIDFDDNPLNITPDFSNMPNLNTLHLRNTELREFPDSLLGLSELEVIDLSENLISTLPSELFEAPAYITNALDLEGNPLSPDSLNRLREYFNQTGIDMNVSFDDVEPIDLGNSEQ